MLSIQQKRSNPFFVLLSLPATAMGFALCIQISALSWILSTKYHLAIQEVGYVWLAGPLAGLLAQPVVGPISDNVWLWADAAAHSLSPGACLLRSCCWHCLFSGS